MRTGRSLGAVTRPALLSMIELLTRVHKTAIAMFSDDEQCNAVPTGSNYRVAYRPGRLFFRISHPHQSPDGAQGLRRGPEARNP